MTPQANHFLAYVAAVGKICNFLGQPCGIDLDQLTVTAQQLSNPLLQPRTISIDQSRRGVFDCRNESVYLIDPFRHFLPERLTFLRAHSFEFSKGFGERFLNTRDRVIAKPLASGLKCRSESRQNVNIEVTSD